MNIIACMVVKNEEDIVEKTILSALHWATKIIIMDNGSTDSTLAIIKELTNKYDKVTLWGVYSGGFRDSIRAIVFNDYSYLCNNEAWWCRLDSDEIYIDDPRDFLSECPRKVDHVYSASFQYYYTKKMIDMEEKDESYISLPIEERLKYYLCDWSEIRFVRITPQTLWPLNFANPLFLNEPYQKRIRLKHYQYRSARQMRSRLLLRKPEENKKFFSHELRKNKIWDESELNYDTGQYIYDDAKLPEMKRRNKILKVVFSLIIHICKVKKIRRFLTPSAELIR
ncbi:TPA: glycosyltransferase family 2 protein [Klebsiella pneumoniae]|nr:glycosyltransferase family 2 protein [Klebsiella pneumoniae]